MITQKRHAEPQDFREALEHLDFPAPRDAVIQKARDRGGLDREVYHILRHIQDRTYRSLEELEQEIERVYQTVGGLPSAGPAAAKKK